MALKLYVGNLPYSTTSDDLRAMFAEYGEVTSATVISDKMTGRSKGFGFVEMATDEAAQAAIAGLNGKDMGGRAIVVNEARPMEERPRRSFGGGNGGHGGRGGFGGGRRDFNRDGGDRW
jgi:cold-inducible RNA-binding protein